MILVTVTNPRYKLLLVLSAVVILLFAFWVLSARQGNIAVDGTPAINEVRELPQAQPDGSEHEQEPDGGQGQGVLDKLKNYYQGK